MENNLMMKITYHWKVSWEWKLDPWTLIPMGKVFSLGILSFRLIFVLELIESAKWGKCIFNFHCVVERLMTVVTGLIITILTDVGRWTECLFTYLGISVSLWKLTFKRMLAIFPSHLASLYMTHSILLARM
jgi:hypothetical protein